MGPLEEQHTLLTAEPSPQSSNDLLATTLMMGRVKEESHRAHSGPVSRGFRKTEVSNNGQELGRWGDDEVKAAILPGLLIKGTSCFACRFKRTTLPGVSRSGSSRNEQGENSR